MRVLITGSRHWNDEATMLARFRELDGTMEEVTIVHGNAAGADHMAGVLAMVLMFKVEVYPADWQHHGKAAGPLRNQVMVDAGAALGLAFPWPESKGTWDCVRRAADAGIPVEIIKRE